MTPPLYQWEDFVVVHREAAQAVIEVKTNLDKDGFRGVADVHQSIVPLDGFGLLPVFGYGIEGSSFETFLEYVRDEIQTNRLRATENRKVANLPFFTVVQSRHYFGFRPLIVGEAQPMNFLAINLEATGRVEEMDGVETGIFFDMLKIALNNKDFDLRYALGIYNCLPIDEKAKFWVDTNGVRHTGNITQGVDTSTHP